MTFILINEKTKIFTLFHISSSFLSEIKYVLVSIKHCSIFVIATKRKRQKIKKLIHDLTNSYLTRTPSFHIMNQIF